jgi:YVTN family beta-propeller protein
MNDFTHPSRGESEALQYTCTLMRPRNRVPTALLLLLLAACAGCAAVGGDEDLASGASADSTHGALGQDVDSTGAPLQLRALLVVAQENERGVAFVNPDTRKVIALTRVGWTPREVAASPDRDQVFVVNYSGDRFGAGSISILSTRARREIDRLDLYPYGAFHGLICGRNGVDLYVASETRRSVLRVNLASRQIEQTYVLPHGSPHLVALDPTETRLYVTDATGPTLFSINLASGGVQEARVGNGPEAVVLAPDGSALWVANRDDGTISVLDPYTLVSTGTFGAGKDPMRIAFDQDMRRAVVVNAGEGSLMVFDARTHARLATVPVGYDPVGLAMEPDGSRAYVASTRDGEIAVVDLSTNTMVDRIKVGVAPSGLVWMDAGR